MNASPRAAVEPRRVQLASVSLPGTNGRRRRVQRHLLIDRAEGVYRVAVYVGRERSTGKSETLREAASRAFGADADADEINLVAACLNAVEIPGS